MLGSPLIHEVKAYERAQCPQHWAKDVFQQWAVPVLTVRSEDKRRIQLKEVNMASLTALRGPSLVLS